MDDRQKLLHCNILQGRVTITKTPYQLNDGLDVYLRAGVLQTRTTNIRAHKNATGFCADRELADFLSRTNQHCTQFLPKNFLGGNALRVFVLVFFVLFIFYSFSSPQGRGHGFG